MSYGLQCWDGSGKLIVDTQQYTTYISQSGSFAAIPGTFPTIIVPGYQQNGRWQLEIDNIVYQFSPGLWVNIEILYKYLTTDTIQLVIPTGIPSGYIVNYIIFRW